jgi:hypothetical protein
MAIEFCKAFGIDRPLLTWKKKSYSVSCDDNQNSSRRPESTKISDDSEFLMKQDFPLSSYLTRNAYFNFSNLISGISVIIEFNFSHTSPRVWT